MISGATRPRLLISIRNASEFAAAVAGADIIDVKDPARGALGMADVGTLREISHVAAREPQPVSLSIALGELRDWQDRRDVPLLPAAVRWLKMGLAGERHSADWQQRLDGVRHCFAATHAAANHSAANQGLPFQWIPVAYADAALVEAPPAEEVLKYALNTGCAGLLIDTATKTGGSLVDWMSPLELLDICRRTREMNLPLALAGKIGSADLEWLSALEPDIIGVRSVVCRHSDRSLPVTAARVAAFRTEIQSAFPEELGPRQTDVRPPKYSAKSNVLVNDGVEFS